MSLSSNVSDLATRIGTEVKSLWTAVNGKAATVHTHVATAISDSTATGRSVVTAADAAAARTAIGAGTSSLAIGTTGTTACAGNDSRLSDARTPTAHTHVATTDLTATGTKDTSTFLRGDNTWAVPPTTPTGWTDLMTTADQNIQVTGFTNVTGLSFTMSANTSYEIEGMFWFTVVATTTGFRVGLAAASAASLNVMFEYPSGAAAQTLVGQTVGNAAVVPAMSATTASPFAAPIPNFVKFRGVIVNGASAQTLNFQAASELTTAAITCKDGSRMSYRAL